MRFKLCYNSYLEGKPTNRGIVVIVDTYKQFRNPWIAENTDQSIRDGIKHFYIQDTIEDNRYPEGYVTTMMSQLPKEDLAFKVVKDIE